MFTTFWQSHDAMLDTHLSVMIQGNDDKWVSGILIHCSHWSKLLSACYIRSGERGKEEVFLDRVYDWLTSAWLLLALLHPWVGQLSVKQNTYELVFASVFEQPQMTGEDEWQNDISHRDLHSCRHVKGLATWTGSAISVLKGNKVLMCSLPFVSPESIPINKVTLGAAYNSPILPPHGPPTHSHSNPAQNISELHKLFTSTFTFHKVDLKRGLDAVI